MASGTSIDWDQLVQERNAWIAHNFPDPDGSRTPLDSVLGCMEELGELTHHHLKQAQSIRGDDEFHEREAKDAIGDLSVYLMGVMSFYNVRPREGGGRPGNPDRILLGVASWVGDLSENENGLRLTGQAELCITCIVATLRLYCEARGWGYDEIVQNTWAHVKQRDWIKYPKTGFPPLEVHIHNIHNHA